MGDSQQSNTPELLRPLDVETILADPKIPKLYGNGFTIGHSMADATIVIQTGKTPIATLSLSFISLKSLYISLGGAIANIERGLGEPIPEIKDLLVNWQKNINK